MNKAGWIWKFALVCAKIGSYPQVVARSDITSENRVARVCTLVALSPKSGQIFQSFTQWNPAYAELLQAFSAAARTLAGWMSCLQFKTSSGAHLEVGLFMIDSLQTSTPHAADDTTVRLLVLDPNGLREPSAAIFPHLLQRTLNWLPEP